MSQINDKKMTADLIDITNAETIAGNNALIGAGLVDALCGIIILTPEIIQQ